MLRNLSRLFVPQKDKDVESEKAQLRARLIAVAVARATNYADALR